ncbi:unnamed protein product [Chrysodeixis includens]|uniref:Uncharacterized protein n=1 Tax=Chrysodeixis includens TaxID=689277 RepID=A0A9N8KNZ5_CHRIL|nr:unnamed protein product [Chrysodeixis includens]
MDEDEKEQMLLAQELARREEEIETLKEMMGGAVSTSPFQPRASLARTPPGSFSPAPAPRTATVAATPSPTPAPQQEVSQKRHLSSPEEVQEAVRRRTAKRSTAPPIGGILTTTPGVAAAAPEAVESGAKGDSQMRSLDKEALIDAVHAAVKAIAGVANASNKLNIGDKNTIAGHGQDILAIVAQLALRLAGAEHEVSAGRLRAAELNSSRVLAAPTVTATAPAPSYANALKLPHGKPPMPVASRGPAVIFYPTRDDIKTSDDTKKLLQEAVKPSAAGIRVTQVRRVGNSGVVVRTATAEAAAKLREAVPPGLRVAEPRSRLPRVALRYLRTEVSGDALIEELHRINLADDAAWPLQRFQSECKVDFKKQLGRSICWYWSAQRRREIPSSP